MLSQRLVRSRTGSYSCCAEAYMVDSLNERIYGNVACAEKYQRLAAWYWWGSDYMNRVPVTTDEQDCKCVTDQEALDAIALLDPQCVRCNDCGDRPRTCEITPDLTVYDAVDASYQGQADPTLYYLIASNLNNLSTTWGTNTFNIVRGTTFTTPNPGQIIYSASDDAYYVRNDQSETTPLFPQLNGSIAGTTLTVTSEWPDTNAYLGRNIVIEVSDDATTWVGAYSGLETVLASPLALTVSSSVLYMRTTYYDPLSSQFRCVYGPFNGLVTPDTIPPLPIRSFSFDTGSFIGPVTPQLLPFNFAGEPTWTIAFYYQSDAPGGVPYNAPVLMQGSDGTSMGTGSTTGSDFGISWSDTGGGGGVYLNATANDTLSDGSWHHVAFVRTTMDTSVSPLMYLDGIFVPLTATPSGIGTIGGADMSIYFGDTSSFVTDPFHMGQIYACSAALTQAQIQSIIIPNIMSNSDGSFGRLFWYQPSLTDNLSTTPYVDGNASGAPDLVGTGAVVFDTVNLPPIP